MYNIRNGKPKRKLRMPVAAEAARQGSSPVIDVLGVFRCSSFDVSADADAFNGQGIRRDHQKLHRQQQRLHIGNGKTRLAACGHFRRVDRCADLMAEQQPANME